LPVLSPNIQGEWNALIAGGMTDTAANRANFAADKIFAYIQGIYQAGSRRENIAAQPALPPAEIRR